MTPTPPLRAATPDLLQAALEQLRLEGAIFFRSELTEGFAFESTPQALADQLHPGAERIILFHIVARGRRRLTVGVRSHHRAARAPSVGRPADHPTRRWRRPC